MTWTYNIATEIGKVRFLIQDTNTDDQLLSDEELQFTLDENSDVNMAAAIAARSIARKLIRRLNQEAAPGGVSLYRRQQAEMYSKLAEELEQKAEGGSSTLQLLTIPTAAIYDDL